MKVTVDELLRSKIRDREKMADAAHRIDEFRRKYGNPPKGFDSVSAIRKLRESR